MTKLVTESQSILQMASVRAYNIKNQQNASKIKETILFNIINPLIATLKRQSNGPSYSNTVIGTLAVDGWAVTFGTVRRGLGRAAACPGTSSLFYSMWQYNCLWNLMG